MTALPLGLPWGRVSAVVLIATVPERPAARGEPGVTIARLVWPPTWVPAAAVMPRSSHRACSQVTIGTAVVRNLLPMFEANDVELITTSCLPFASALVLAMS